MERRQSQGLVDILDKILDKGLVVAGDVKVSLANVELLTIRLRLIVCSIDKAEQIGLDWWRGDRYFSAPREVATAGELETMRKRLEALERRSLQSGKSSVKGGAKKKKAEDRVSPRKRKG